MFVRTECTTKIIVHVNGDEALSLYIYSDTCKFHNEQYINVQLNAERQMFPVGIPRGLYVCMGYARFHESTYMCIYFPACEEKAAFGERERERAGSYVDRTKIIALSYQDVNQLKVYIQGGKLYQRDKVV